MRRFVEACSVGDQIVTPGRTITETDVVSFAAFTGDWNSVHTDAEYAKTTPFGERIAHGLLTLTTGFALLFRLGEGAFLPQSLLAVTNMDRVRFLKPIKIGETIHLVCEIVEITGMPEQRGLITLRCRIKNQRDETVIAFRVKALAGCRPLLSEEVDIDG